MWSQFWEMLRMLTTPFPFIHVTVCYWYTKCSISRVCTFCVCVSSICLSIYNLPPVCMKSAATLSSSHLCVITVSTLIQFSFGDIILEKTLINFIPPCATFQWGVFIHNTTSFPLCLVSSFAGKLLIIPTSLRYQPTHSTASPATCWQCKISVGGTTCMIYACV